MYSNTDGVHPLKPLIRKRKADSQSTPNLKVEDKNFHEPTKSFIIPSFMDEIESETEMKQFSTSKLPRKKVLQAEFK